MSRYDAVVRDPRPVDAMDFLPGLIRDWMPAEASTDCEDLSSEFPPTALFFLSLVRESFLHPDQLDYLEIKRRELKALAKRSGDFEKSLAYISSLGLQGMLVIEDLSGILYVERLEELA